MALARYSVKKKGYKHKIPLPKICSSALLPLILACLLQIGYLLHMVIESIIYREVEVTHICIVEYITVTLMMYVLLFVAFKTAKDLLLQNRLEQDGAAATLNKQNHRAAQTNLFQEVIFEGDVEESESEACTEDINQTAMFNGEEKTDKLLKKNRKFSTKVSQR